jgi:hypothetical protein
VEPATAKGPPGFFGLVSQGKMPTDADIDRMARDKWRDLPQGQSPCDWCSTAGLFKRGGTKPKPAWRHYVRFTGGL